MSVPPLTLAKETKQPTQFGVRLRLGFPAPTWFVPTMAIFRTLEFGESSLRAMALSVIWSVVTPRPEPTKWIGHRPVEEGGLKWVAA